jgi:hypothetical protein
MPPVSGNATVARPIPLSAADAISYLAGVFNHL